jgi:hypothetical protein
LFRDAVCPWAYSAAPALIVLLAVAGGMGRFVRLPGLS